MMNRIDKLTVSGNGRFLTYEDGAPFFYLGDTAWELFHRLDRAEADHYLINRAGKGFGVIQAVLLAELNGLTEPNRYGHLPLDERDPARPIEGYFEHVDYVVNKAAEQGLYLALLPTWGAHVVKENHPLFQNYPIFTPENARAYGRFLGKRYRDAKNVLWILGGDRSPEGYVPIWEAMAKGLKDGDGGSHLIGYHPGGGSSSSQHLHEVPWLDFNMLQSGHTRVAEPNHEMIAADYAKTPARPTFDAEPNYEGGAVGFSEANRM